MPSPALADNYSATIGCYPNHDRRNLTAGLNRGSPPRLSSADQNIVLLFAAVSGIGWMTSQCSTTLPFSDR